MNTRTFTWAIPYWLVSFLLGLSSAFIFPLFSLYLTLEIELNKTYLGAFFIIMVLSSIGASHQLARISDHSGKRKAILMLGQGALLLATLVFASVAQLWVTLATVVLVLSVGGIASPLVFTLARERAEEIGGQYQLALSIQRACISVAWISGPPLAFWLYAQYGVQTAFYLAALFIALAIMLSQFFITDQYLKPSKTPINNPSLRVREPHILLFIAMAALLFSTNYLYVQLLPLYMQDKMPDQPLIAGWLMGATALLEVPVMVLAGWMALRLGETKLLVVACLANAGFYALLVQVNGVAPLLVIQGLNALAIGLLSTMGLLCIQNWMPHHLGQASTLFNNAMQGGMLLAGLMTALFAEQWGIGVLYQGNSGLSMLALAAFGLAIRYRANAKID